MGWQLKSKITVIYSFDKGYRANCILSFLPKNSQSKILSSNRTVYSYLQAIYYSVHLLGKQKKIIVVVSHDLLLFTSLLLAVFPWTRKKVIVDFYDIFSLRDKIPTPSTPVFEKNIYKYGTAFLARSFELNCFRRNLGAWKRKRFFFLPDLIYKDMPEINYSNLDIYSTKLVFLGGINTDHLLKMSKLSPEIDVDIFLPPSANLYKTTLHFFDLIKKNICLNIGIHQSQFSSILKRYTAGIALISETDAIYNYSAAIKYMAYLESGIYVLTDPRHRISKWYARYFNDQIIFIDDTNLQKLNLEEIKNLGLNRCNTLYSMRYCKLCANLKKKLSFFIE